jgi:tripartite-type tricarboxylate transporter receptor subunit TctC
MFKRINRLHKGIIVLGLLLMLIFALTAFGQQAADYPNQPINLICGSGLGGGTDSMMRGIMLYFAQNIGGQVRAENMNGAHGLIAANAIFKAKPDGYTLYVMNNAYEIDIMMNKDQATTGLSSLSNFVPVASWLNADGNAFAVVKGSSVKTMEDLAALANTKTVTVALAGGIGSSDHITFLMASKIYGGKYQIVPYDSGGEAVAALLGKHVDCAVVSLSGDAVNPDQLDLIATTLENRVDSFPNAPTFKELGKPELSLSFHVGMMAPPGTPPDIIEKLDNALKKSFDDPAFQEWAKNTGKPIGEYYGHERWGEFLKNYTASLSNIMDVILEAVKAE